MQFYKLAPGDIFVIHDEIDLPLGKVKDFAPYVSKIRASGADTVLTGNWGNDLVLLIKAIRRGSIVPPFWNRTKTN